ncbi:hypothetical protein L204_101405 [Cryptococcus depauperatus]|nr:hypothetical protein L204_04076 [Cryptococcus depauperatus CBS 7855]
MPKGLLPETDEGDIVRTFVPASDEKMLKMIVGQGIMEGLARANNKTILHPAVFAITLILGSAFDYYFNLYPSSNPLSYISPLIGPCIALLPIMGVIEYLNRPAFTALLRRTIGAIDMVKPDVYYRQGRSGIWVFQHKRELIGAVCLDGTDNAGQKLETVLGEEEGQLSTARMVYTLISEEMDLKQLPPQLGKHTATEKKSTPLPKKIAQIRHLDVYQPWRRSGVGSELLLAALDYAFGIGSLQSAAPTVEAVIVHFSPFSPGGSKIFKKCGFNYMTQEEIDQTWSTNEKIGTLGWQGRWMKINKEAWLIKRKEMLTKRPF